MSKKEIYLMPNGEAAAMNEITFLFKNVDLCVEFIEHIKANCPDLISFLEENEVYMLLDDETSDKVNKTEVIE